MGGRQGAILKFVSLKTVLLLALALAKRMDDIHALSVHLSYPQFFMGGMRMVLKPNSAFVPKVVASFSPLTWLPLPLHLGISVLTRCSRFVWCVFMWIGPGISRGEIGSLSPGPVHARADLSKSNASPTG